MRAACVVILTMLEVGIALTYLDTDWRRAAYWFLAAIMTVVISPL